MSIMAQRVWGVGEKKLKLIVYCFSLDNKRIQKRISVSCVRTIGRNACLTPASPASHKSLDLCLGNVGPFLLDMTPDSFVWNNTIPNLVHTDHRYIEHYNDVYE